MAAAFTLKNGIERTNMIHVSAEGSIVLELQSEFYGSDKRRRGHITERALGHAAYIDHEGDAAAGPDVNRRAAAGDAGESVPHRMRQAHGILGDAGPQRTPRTAQDRNRRERGLAILLDAGDRPGEGSGQFSFHGP